MECLLVLLTASFFVVILKKYLTYFAMPQKGKILEKRTMKSCVAAGLIAVFTLFLFVTVIPEEVHAASNKAFKLKVSFNGKESTTDKIWDQNTYSVQTDLKNTSKLNKKPLFPIEYWFLRSF